MNSSKYPHSNYNSLLSEYRISLAVKSHQLKWIQLAYDELNKIKKNSYLPKCREIRIARRGRKM